MERLGMTRNGSIGMLIAVLALTGLASRAGAQQTSDTRIRELIKEAAAGVASGIAQTQQIAPTGGDSRPVVPLTLDDAVKARARSQPRHRGPAAEPRD